jgi:DNA-binding transcriptional LysR family regulator
VAPLVASLRDATRTLGTGGKEPEGLLRITAPNDIGSAFLSEEVVRFAERYPLLRVELILTNRKLNLVSEGIDVAVRAGRLESSSLVARKVGTLQVEFFASPSYAEHHRLPVTTSSRSVRATAKSAGSSRARAARRAWSSPAASPVTILDSCARRPSPAAASASSRA